VEVVEVVVDRLDPDRGRLTRALFRFLYSQTLTELATASADGAGIRLRVDDVLLEGSTDFADEWRTMYPDIEAGEEEGERDLTAQWAPLELLVRGVLGRDLALRFSWHPYSEPGMAALARLVARRGGVSRFGPEWDTLEEWCEHALDPDRDLGGTLPTPEVLGPVHDWHETRRRAYDVWCRSGISAPLLDEYVQEWRDLLGRVVESHRPAGSREPTLDTFLDNETLKLSSGRTVLLSSHPLRLRWFAHHLRHLGRHLQQALEGRFALNEAVEDFYFDRISNVSPHKQPPVLATDQGELGYAVREYGGHEEFAPIQKRTTASRDWIAAIDDACIDEMAAVAHRFIEAYPHKTDGLAILFVSLEGDAGHVERLVKRIRQREHARVVVTIHVVAPVLTHDRIARALEALDDQDDTDSLMPAIRTVVHSEKQLQAGGAVELDEQIDLAFAPNLFGTQTVLLTQTRTGASSAGGFDPWRDPATHDSAVVEGRPSENVSRALVPEREDELLRAWSTLNVWRYTQTPIASGAYEEVDYREAYDFFALQVRFSDSLELFMRLHGWAHWVVSLDPFVGREQIEALETRPDIITVKPRVGKNGHYTLVVSSHAGKAFIVARLRKKLEDELRVATGEGAEQLATVLYESGRTFAPGVILRALGLGRTTHEIVGLLVARWLVEEYFPRPADALFEAWIPLDDQIHWFGGVPPPFRFCRRSAGVKMQDSRSAASSRSPL